MSATPTSDRTSFEGATAWWPEVKLRMRRHWFLKFAGTTLGTWAFFIGYFQLLRHAAYPVLEMPVTSLETAIPVMPIAVAPYLSLWFYIGIAPGLQRTFKELLAYGAWAGLLCVIGLGIFYRWPTRIPTFVFDRGGSPGLALIEGIDASGNACPSMHVAIAMFTAIWIGVQLRECRVPMGWRAGNWVWCTAITYSTIAIRQHVLIDVVAGAALGVACAIPSLLMRPGRGTKPSSPREATAIIAAPDRFDRADVVEAATDEHRGRRSRATKRCSKMIPETIPSGTTTKGWTQARWTQSQKTTEHGKQEARVRSPNCNR